MKKIMIIVLCIILSFMLIGCSKKSELLGQWVPESENVPSDFPEDMEFFKDNTLDVSGIAGTYSVDDGRLILKAFGLGEWDYEVSENTLILTTNGESFTYIKK